MYRFVVAIIIFPDQTGIFKNFLHMFTDNCYLKVPFDKHYAWFEILQQASNWDMITFFYVALSLLKACIANLKLWSKEA